MRTIICALIVSPALALAAVPALAMIADTPKPDRALRMASDHNGYEELARGDYDAAERKLIEVRRTFPKDPELMLNLAAVYMHSSRPSDAARLYRQVLDRPNALMDLPSDKAVWSHAVAGAALKRLARLTMTAR